MRYLLERWMWKGLRRGFLSGSRTWLYLGIGAGAVNFFLRFFSRPPAEVVRVRLHEDGAFRVRARAR
ncbi:MAG: hypothetical protein ACOYN3_09445 [Acidimicrobiia bacterium]